MESSGAELAALDLENDLLRQRVHQMTTFAENAVSSQVNLEFVVAELNEHIEALRVRCDSLELSNSELEHELAATLERCSSIEAQLSACVHAMETSRTLKITKPFRRVVALMRRAR